MALRAKHTTCAHSVMPGHAATTCLRAASKIVDTGMRRHDGSDNRAHGETIRLSCVEP
jgi:hypothetical protein